MIMKTRYPCKAFSICCKLCWRSREGFYGNFWWMIRWVGIMPLIYVKVSYPFIFSHFLYNTHTQFHLIISSSFTPSHSHTLSLSTGMCGDCHVGSTMLYLYQRLFPRTVLCRLYEPQGATNNHIFLFRPIPDTPYQHTLSM